MAKNRKFAFIINYGIEYRMYLISGLLEELSKSNQVVVIRRDIENKYFDEYKSIFDFETITLDNRLMNPKRTKLENIFQSIRQSRIKLLGKTPFKNYNIKKNKLLFKDIIKGNFLTFNIARLFTLKSISKNYSDDELKNILKKGGITDIVISGYSSTCNINFAINSLASNIKVWTFINSWKDYYINDFLPFKANGFFVWSESMKHDFLSTNTHINKNIIYPTGNIVFDRFYNPIISFKREYYQNKYNFKNTDKLFLYCMLDPDRYQDEEKIILLISKKLKETQFDFKILVKKNPFDSSLKVNHFFKNNEDISVLEHYSQRDKKNDFFIQSINGEKEWIDLLAYSNYILGAASTVALEAIMMKKPVLTICFDKNGNEDRFLKTLCEVDFYKELLKREDIHVSSNTRQLLEKISTNKKILEFIVPSILGIFEGKSLDKVINIMEKK
ncbi:MAG: hypothetical protein CL623_11855 [Arcobacter sp.]|nr:hypothetical protein [Arcobacter sp.]|tara:strand:- start:11987 stop:13318 length:1332 start_codon:yes stop_codon:yes gene_type:complete